MKSVFSTLFLLNLILFFPSSLRADNFSFEPDKVTDYELSMQTYEKDANAPALIIREKCSLLIDRVAKSSYFIKIKILNPDGLDYANINKIYNKADTDIQNIRTCVYNRNEDGTIDKKYLNKEYVSKDQLEGSVYSQKIALMGVKVGSVIEFSCDYVFPADLSGKYYFQHEIPVVSSSFELMDLYNIPYRYSITGLYKVDVSNEKTGGYNSYNKTIFSICDLPAFEQNVTMLFCPDDYRTAVELSNKLYKTDTKNQNNSNKKSLYDDFLPENDHFGRWMEIKTPLEQEVRALTLDSPDRKTLVARLFSLLRSHLKWDREYALVSENPVKTLASGNATNADFNFLIMAMMRECGILSVPVAVCTRNRGKVTDFENEYLYKVNTFVVCYLDDRNNLAYIDGSMPEFQENAIPAVLRVDRARVFKIQPWRYNFPKAKAALREIYKKTDNDWVDLSGVGINSELIQCNMVVDAQGGVSGEAITGFSGLDAFEKLDEIQSFSDSIKHIEHLEKLLNVTIDSYTVNHTDGNLSESLSYSFAADSSANELFINPLKLLVFNQAMFQEAERKLPFEFPFKQICVYSSSLEIDESLEIVTLPERKLFRISDNGCTCAISYIKDGNIIRTQYQFSLNRLFYDAQDFQTLKDFFSMLLDNKHTMVVLRKK